jgi:hypothetical protein
MNGRTLLWILICGAIATACPQRLPAAAPWTRIMALKRAVPDDPNENYPITDGNGPWMIMAATFSGDGAEEDALKLVHELRRKHNLPAYTFQKKFDYSKGVPARGYDRYGAPLVMKYQQDHDVVEVAVLVGDFPSAADPEGQKTLKRLKGLHPGCLKVKDGQSSSLSLAGVRAFQNSLPDETGVKKMGPLGHAFMTANPKLPTEYFAPKGIDKLVLDMNKHVKHSLLNCPGKYTVKVATFTGSVIISQKIIVAAEQGGRFKSQLANAAEKAHKLTEALREKGVEAYEFHDRNSSIVTVGSFDSVGTPRPDGKIEINPAIHTIMKTYGAETSVSAGGARVGQAKKLHGISYDVQPLPVEVPRRSISSDYDRTADSR